MNPERLRRHEELPSRTNAKQRPPICRHAFKREVQLATLVAFLLAAAIYLPILRTTHKARTTK